VIVSSASPVFAADNQASDLEAAKTYLGFYSLYDLSDATRNAVTVADMMTEHAKTDRWARYYNAEDFAAYETIRTLVGMPAGPR
jgi:hypothetical protein